MKKVSQYSKFTFSLCFLILLYSCASNDAITATIPPSLTDNFVPPSTENIVMYEINPLAFSPTQNLQGITSKLDYIKNLGINTIWIMPIYPVGVLNAFGSPYCVKNYTAVRASLGSLQDLKNLTTLAHQKGIAVILDWVANHTSWDNSWITAHPSWYTQNSNGQIISPAGTNWNDVADLNFDNQDMRLAMIESMKFWVTNANIDGFRCDAADYVPYDFWLQANTALNSIPNKQLILLAEGNRSDHFNAGFQMNFAWDYLTAEKNVFGINQTSATNLFITNSNEYSVVPTNKKKLRFTTNHDESNNATPISVYGDKEGALAASVVAVYLQGVPLLYCGQEVGVSSATVYNGTNNIDWNVNHDMLESYRSLFHFYNSSTTAKTGLLTTYDDANVVLFTKSISSQQVFVIANTRNSIQTLSVPSILQGNWINALTGEPFSISGNLSLAAYEYYILKK